MRYLTETLVLLKDYSTVIKPGSKYAASPAIF